MILIMKMFLLIALFFFLVSEAYADIYKHVSQDGVIFFSNTSLGADSKIVVRERKVSLKSHREHGPVSSIGAVPKVADLAESAVWVGELSPEAIHEAVEEKAKQHNIDPNLVKAVIRVESNWNPGAVSRKGALGLMQLMPSTAALLGVANPFDPLENIDGGVRYLKHLIGRFNGDLILALAAYNAGPKIVEKRGMVPSIPETVAYVKRVMEYYNGGQEINLSVNAQAIQRAIRKEFKSIKKVVLEDGTLLFTNAYSARSN
jgi:hypothetical protein